MIVLTDGGEDMPTLFAREDGLHLNYAGTDLLRKTIINIIKHLSVH
jgi:hypothetical protein